MGNIDLILARPEDAPSLAAVSRRAFDSDQAVGAPGSGGPPGYDSVEWQREMMLKASAYWAILLDDQLAGGAIVMCFPRGRYYLARIFLDPDFHRRGIGTRVMEAILAQYPEARVWRLETPPWNTRTKAFYKKLGFRIVRETDSDLYFQKTVNEGHGE